MKTAEIKSVKKVKVSVFVLLENPEGNIIGVFSTEEAVQAYADKEMKYLNKTYGLDNEQLEDSLYYEEWELQS